MVDYTTVFVEGTVYWPKVIGAPRMNYEGDGREWSLDFVPDDTDFLKEHNLLDRLKEARDPIPSDYIRLRKKELNKDGDKQEPIRVYNSDGEPWGTDLLGNRTRVVMKITIADYGRGKKKGIYPTAIRVEEHVPFVSDEFGGFTKGSAKRDEFKAKPKPKAKAEDLAELEDNPPF